MAEARLLNETERCFLATLGKGDRASSRGWCVVSMVLEALEDDDELEVDEMSWVDCVGGSVAVRLVGEACALLQLLIEGSIRFMMSDDESETGSDAE